jgi:ABC-type multidrug transport system ATPase subunit
VTIILTTHYTEEADYLCNRILIIDFGKIVALDTPESLKARLKGDIVGLIFKDSSASSKIRPLLENQNWVIHVHVLPDHANQITGGRMANMMRGMTFDTRNMGGSNIHGSISHKPDKHPLGTQLHGRMDQQDSPGHLAVSRRLNLLVDDGGRRIPNIVKLADKVGVTLESVELHKPTLDDVFISATGRNIRDEQGSFIEMIRRFRIMRQARGKPVHS